MHTLPANENTANKDVLVDVENISLTFSGKQVLKDINLQVSAGEFVTLIGPNGAGKTSLVHIILGLLEPSQGRILRRPKLRIGYMPQKLRIDANLPITVNRFLRLANKDTKAIAKALEEVDMASVANAPLAAISGGEMQRVFLARAILRNPQLLVLDEPVQGVDVGGQTLLYQLINQIKEHYGCGVLMVSHDLHLVMASTDTVMCLNHHICCHGRPDSITSDPEYLSLFGKADSSTLALYTHNHDHHHNIHGDVISDGSD